MGDGAVLAHPAVDALVDEGMFADLAPAGHSHDGIMARGLDDGRASTLHLRPAPGVDGKVRVAVLELRDHGGGVVIAAWLEGREEEASTDVGRVRDAHTHQ